MPTLGAAAALAIGTSAGATAIANPKNIAAEAVLRAMCDSESLSGTTVLVPSSVAAATLEQ